MCETWHSYPNLTILTSSLLVQDTVPLTSTEISVLSTSQDRASPQCLPQSLSFYGDLHLPEHYYYGIRDKMVQNGLHASLYMLVSIYFRHYSLETVLSNLQNARSWFSNRV